VGRMIAASKRLPGRCNGSAAAIWATVNSGSGAGVAVTDRTERNSAWPASA